MSTSVEDCIVLAPMATWNLESVGTKGYGGGGSYLCARAAKAILKSKQQRAEENYDGIGVFKDPLMDSVYGQCSSTTRPVRQVCLNAL